MTVLSNYLISVLSIAVMEVLQTCMDISVISATKQCYNGHPTIAVC